LKFPAKIIKFYISKRNLFLKQRLEQMDKKNPAASVGTAAGG
jgi:hypothetical protein